MANEAKNGLPLDNEMEKRAWQNVRKKNLAKTKITPERVQFILSNCDFFSCQPKMVKRSLKVTKCVRCWCRCYCSSIASRVIIMCVWMWIWTSPRWTHSATFTECICDCSRVQTWDKETIAMAVQAFVFITTPPSIPFILQCVFSVILLRLITLFHWRVCEGKNAHWEWKMERESNSGGDIPQWCDRSHSISINDEQCWGGKEKTRMIV